MTDNDYKIIKEIQFRWQKEQQLIRKKYQIPYNMIFTSKKCINKSTSHALQNELFLKKEKNMDTHTYSKTKISQPNKQHYDMINNDFNIPPMYCSKCDLNLIECICLNGLGQWWNNLQKRTYSKDKISKNSSLNSLHNRHIHFDLSLTNLSSLDESKPTNHKDIHLHSSTISNSILCSQSELIANNENLNQVLYSIQKIATLLGIKFDHSFSNEYLQETKQSRNSILNQQSSFIASKVPYNTFRNTSIHTQ